MIGAGRHSSSAPGGDQRHHQVGSLTLGDESPERMGAGRVRTTRDQHDRDPDACRPGLQVGYGGAALDLKALGPQE